MGRSDEHARRGYQLLLKRDDFASFFPTLQAAGFFLPEKSPGAVPSDKPGYVRIPYWDALDYLEAVARRATETNDEALITSVLEVVRAVTRRDGGDGSLDNYHTAKSFAEILAIVPLEAITDDDIELLPIWLRSPYDRGLVGTTIGKGLVLRLLESDREVDRARACRVLFHSTEIVWGDSKEPDARNQALTRIEDFWLKNFIDKTAPVYGLKAGAAAAEIMLSRLREAYEASGIDRLSWLRRPAVEEHSQNHSWEGPINRFVEGLRDILVTWIGAEPATAREFVARLLAGDLQIGRRIAIHAIRERWDDLRALFVKSLDRELFESAHLHELYELLSSRFASMTEEEKAKVVQVIQSLSPSEKAEDPQRQLRYVQRNWLTAIAGKGDAHADRWFQELVDDKALGALSEHPNFHSYMESWWGPGPSPYLVPELVQFAGSGELISRLNAFKSPGTWKGPTTRALVDVLEEAIKGSPMLFFALREQFLQTRRAYQYALINAFKTLWDSNQGVGKALEWNDVWPGLIDIFEQLVLKPWFWTEDIDQDADMTPNRDWIPPLISDFLSAGTKVDEHSFSPLLMPRAFNLIDALVEKSESTEEAQVDDAMTQAINQPKGKAIEALMNYALRASRLEDAGGSGHLEAWGLVRPIFDTEIAKCRNANFEFSTLAGAYLANIEYLNRDWLVNNVEKIFPRDFAVNFECALDGFAYSPATRSTYKLLKDREVVERALRFGMARRQARERLVERVTLAYLWGDETLDLPPFSMLFESERQSDLQTAAGFLWGVSNQKLPDPQVEKVVEFFMRAVKAGSERKPVAGELLSTLSRLAIFLHNVSAKEEELLLTVAPFVNVGYHADEFIEQLSRLADASPAAVSKVLERTLDAYRPFHDYEDHLRILIEKLAAAGLRADAMGYADKLKHLPGFLELYARLIGATPAST